MLSIHFFLGFPWGGDHVYDRVEAHYAYRSVCMRFTIFTWSKYVSLRVCKTWTMSFSMEHLHKNGYLGIKRL